MRISSTAQRSYWLGRYLERAGSTARLVSVNANLLIDLPVRLPLGWLPLIDILAQENEFEALYGDFTQNPNNALDENEKRVRYPGHPTNISTTHICLPKTFCRSRSAAPGATTA